MKWKLVMLSLFLGAAAPADAWADGERGADPIASRLFPPDLILAHLGELKLDDKQRDAIVADVQKTQAQLIGFEWQMKEATDELARLLDAPRVDEAKALAQADRMMAIEQKYKRGHLGLLIRIRNLLTETQRARLAGLRKAGP